jgi:NTE family protein
MRLQKIVITLIFGLSVSLGFSQKVALVMSGGGAKGLAHVGVIKALEENNIPIDYLVGTSMGGVVAGCYAAGYSAQQIEGIMLSPQFQDWVNGVFEKGYNYYLYKDKSNSSFLTIQLSLDSIFNASLNSSLASDVTLNFALPEFLAKASAIANNNFDSLYVPTRIIAADIFTQNEVVLKNASLALALRTTLSVPFFYKPIKIDNKYLFDGGIYNNFPVDVAIKDFDPDVIIGSNVSSKVFNDYPYDNDDKLINSSLLFMLIDKSNPDAIPDNGVYIEPNLSEYTAFDFAKVKDLIDSGYNATMKNMDSIKAKIGSRRTAAELKVKRENFLGKGEALNFSQINFHGYNSKQRQYINKLFKYKPGELLNLEEIKRGYFKLVSEDYFNTVYPDISFNPQLKNYSLELFGRPRSNLNVEVGGAIASRNISQIFLGAEFYYFNNYLLKTSMNFYSGSFYKSAQMRSRLYMAWPFQYYIEPELTYNNFDFLNSDDIFIDEDAPAILDRTDRKYGVNVGIPLGNKLKTVLSGAFINNSDQYGNNLGITSSDTLDLLKLRGFRAGISLGRNNFNRKQYANEGKGLKISLDYFAIEEDYKPGTTSSDYAYTDQNEWFKLSIKWEQFFKKNRWSTGYSFDGVYSGQGYFANYNGTLINLPSFNPLQDSKSQFLPNFRAYSFAALGIKNILSLKSNLDFRLEGYAFKPFQTLAQENDLLVKKENTEDVFFVGSSSLVLHSPVGPICLALNYYDQENIKFGVLLHVGFLLYNDSSMGR